MIELTVFLGNPGGEYAGNRHNAGRFLAEGLPFFSSLPWRRKYKGLYAPFEGAKASPGSVPPAGPPPGPGETGPRVSPAGTRHFLMPETYMNRSGDSVYAAASFFKIPPERILVVHDELELPLGTAGLKFSGGLGGHNGLRSVKGTLGTADFWRFRIGIGRPNHDDISGWVLSDFTPQERPPLDQVLAASAEALVRILAEGPETLLPEWHKKRIWPPLNEPRPAA